MKISYNWLKSYIPEICEPEKLWDVFTFHLCEVESVTPVIPDPIRDLGDESKNINPDSGSGAGMTKPEDWIFDINILPNRSHDLLSHQGVAQELAALLNIEYKSPVEMYKIPESKPTELSIKIESDKCRRYMGRIVRNVKVGPSPEWVVKHLESIGQKSINNVVDATNIVLFDCGQPTHVFDEKKVGNTICIKESGSEGNITVLGGEEKNLKENDLIIADDEGNPLAIAGVKGGTKAEVDENTTDIILEVANFDPVSTRKTGRRLSLFTDALKRFENDLSPVRAEYAMTELSALILEMHSPLLVEGCPQPIFEDVVDARPNGHTYVVGRDFPEKEKWQELKTIETEVSYINSKLGANFSSEEIENVWKRMKFTYVKNGDEFVVTVPDLRLDLIGPHDLVEEVGRVLGYDRVEPQLPNINFTPKINNTMYSILAARQKLVAEGFREVYTYSFTKKGKVEVAYGAKGKEALRTNLSDGLKAAYELNRLNAPFLEIDQKDLAIFEIGHVYKGELGEMGDFGDVSPEVLHVAWMNKNGVQEMTLSEYIKQAQISTEDLNVMKYSDLLPSTKYDSLDAKFIPWSEYPFTYRDISLWVPKEVESEQVSKIIKENAGELLVKGPNLIDSFEKDGRKSLAFRLVFQSPDKTLTDEEVLGYMKNVEKSLLDSGFEIR